jgi:hypothetical protein
MLTCSLPPESRARHIVRLACSRCTKYLVWRSEGATAMVEHGTYFRARNQTLWLRSVQTIQRPRSMTMADAEIVSPGLLYLGTHNHGQGVACQDSEGVCAAVRSSRFSSTKKTVAAGPDRCHDKAGVESIVSRRLRNSHRTAWALLSTRNMLFAFRARQLAISFLNKKNVK